MDYDDEVHWPAIVRNARTRGIAIQLGASRIARLAPGVELGGETDAWLLGVLFGTAPRPIAAFSSQSTNLHDLATRLHE